MKPYWQDNYDYPMSWGCWRSLCVSHRDIDPGTDRLPDYTLEELEKRITEGANSGFVTPKVEPVKITYNLEQLQGKVKYLENKVNELCKPKVKRDRL